MSIIVNNELLKIAGLNLQNANLWELYEEKQSEIKYRVKSITLPFLSLETFTRKTGTKHYSDYTPEGEFDISVYELDNFSTYDYLKKWLDEVYDPDTKVFNAGVGVGIRNLILAFQVDDIYSVNAKMVHGERVYNKSFKFERTKIKKISPIDLNYEGTDPLILTATFIADKIIEIPTSSLSNKTSMSSILIP